ELYIEKVLSRFRVNDAKPRTTPLGNHFKLSKEQSPKTTEERDHMTLVPYALAVGSLMYAMVCTRPDIEHAVGVVSRYMANPGKEHWEAVKWLLRYLRGTSSTSLCFGKGKVTLQGFVDADLGGDVDSSKSTSGYIYTIGGIAVSWMSRLQKCVSLSSTKAELVDGTTLSLTSHQDHLPKTKVLLSHCAASLLTSTEYHSLQVLLSHCAASLLTSTEYHSLQFCIFSNQKNEKLVPPDAALAFFSMRALLLLPKVLLSHCAASLLTSTEYHSLQKNEKLIPPDAALAFFSMRALLLLPKVHDT
uniref:Reverse transcriptase Ty1/copia-type domain-containing protein n=1 Tax=Solanum lycopersicum TaxID=4081 RepID=A0A3Q7EB23_SOLLC